MSKCKRYASTFSIILSIFFIIHYLTSESPINNIKAKFTQSADDFFISTAGCQIPKMQVYDPVILKFLKRVPRIQCSKIPPLIQSNQTTLWIDNQVRKRYSKQNITCCFYPFWRVANGSKPDLNIYVSKNCYFFTNSIEVRDEFVQVECKANRKVVYTDFHAFIVSNTSFNINESSKLENNILPDAQVGLPSVMIIGVDSVSRLNFYRQMPKTQKYLKSLDAIEYYGYNKIADNTFPNVISIFTGFTPNELRPICWPKKSSFFDSCPFLWNNYSARGYRTVFAEDTVFMGLFLYLKNGFYKQPTDHYLQPFMKMNEDKIGWPVRYKTKKCFGPRLAPKVLFDYAEKLAVNLTLTRQPFFGYFWGTTYTHDELNIPPDNDEIYETFLKKLHNNKILENTIVIFLSDHGIRFGDVRKTYQGRIEERLPFIYFLIPKWFQKNYTIAMKNLVENQKKLTTPFDVHNTLVDLLDLSTIRDDVIKDRNRNSRGISLFLPIPESRTCETAGITQDWCTCHLSREIAIDAPKVINAASVVISHLNHILFQFIQCSQLTVNKIMSARIGSASNKVTSNANEILEDILLVLETVPGEAHFEALVRIEDGTMHVLGYVSRINAYGDQGNCVGDFNIRLYCYCVDGQQT